MKGITYHVINVQIAPELTVIARRPLCEVCNLPASRYFLAWRDAEDWAKRHTAEFHTPNTVKAWNKLDTVAQREGGK